MKKLLTIILVLSALYSNAQDTIKYTPMTAAGYRFKYFIADSGHTVPFKDTALDRGTTRPGSLVCYTGDSAVYWWNGLMWRPIGSNVTTGTITSRIDSATFYSGTLCFWTEGASQCYDLSSYFCNSEYNHDTTKILFYNCDGDLVDSLAYPFSYVDVIYPLVKTTVGDTTYFGINGALGEQLLGGIVSHDTLYTYDVTSAVYTINGVQYTSTAGSTTLDAADDTYDRQDIIALDTNGNIVNIPGVAAEDPQLPQVDPLSQIYLTSIYVTASTTAPSNITREEIYDENVENWNRTITAGLTVNADNTVNPYHLVKSLDVGSWATTKGILFTRAAGAIPAGTYSLFKMFIKLKAAVPVNSVRVTFYNANVVQSSVNLSMAHGFDLNSTEYQNVTVPFTGIITRIQITFLNAGSGAYIDYVQLQGGITNGNSPFITDVFRKAATDSVFKVINGVNVFAFRDSTGGGSNTLQEAYDAAPLANPLINFRGNDVTFDSLQNTVFNFAGGDYRTVDFNNATYYAFATIPYFPDYNAHHDRANFTIDGNLTNLYTTNDSSQAVLSLTGGEGADLDEYALSLSSITTRSSVTQQHEIAVLPDVINFSRQIGSDTTGLKVVFRGVDTLSTSPTYIYVPHNDTLKVYPYPSGGSVTGVYEEIIATAAQTTFSFTTVPASTSKYMIYRNGAAIPKSYYSVSGNDIIFSAGLVEGDSVVIQGVQ